MSSKYGVKVSKEGFDVRTAGYNELLFTSEFPALKINKQGSGTVTLDGSGDATATINHNLGIKPYHLVFSQYIDANGDKIENYSITPIGLWPLGGVLDDLIIIVSSVGTSDLKIKYNFNSSFSGETLNYIYYIFEDPVFV